MVMWTAATVVLTALTAGMAVWVLKPFPSPRVVRFAYTPPAEIPLMVAANYRDIAISPDGTRIVYVAGTTRRIYIRALGQFEPNQLLNTVQSRAPFSSPDGSEVAFYVQGENSLKRTAAQGGPQQTIVSNIGSGLRGASWGPDNRIVFATGTSQGLLRVPVTGGELEVLTTAGQEGIAHWWPEVLPNGQAVLFTSWSGSDETSHIVALDLESGNQSVLIAGGSSPHYAQTGHIVYTLADTLWAVPFDLDGLTVTGDPVPVQENVLTKANGGANFDLSDDGVLVYTRADGAAAQSAVLVWVDREGRENPLSTPPGDYHSLQLSPDGTEVLLSVQDQGGRDVWSSDLTRGTLSKLTTDRGREDFPLWMSDGERFVFGASVGGEAGVYITAADGTGGVDQLFVTDASVTAGVPAPVAWSADGQTLVFSYQVNERDIGVFRMGGEGSWEALLDSPSEELTPSLSPDGQWLAYTSDETGRREVYVRRFPALGSKQLVSIGGGVQPLWSPLGDELFYMRTAGLAETDAVMRVSVRTGQVLTLGVAEPVFEFPPGTYAVRPPYPTREYDVDRDAQRFLMLKRSGLAEVGPARINVVLNWTQELLERVPVP